MWGQPPPAVRPGKARRRISLADLLTLVNAAGSRQIGPSPWPCPSPWPYPWPWSCPSPWKSGPSRAV